MKTLDQIPPTWSQKLPGAQRFEVVLDGAAALDKETGLVWQISPVDFSNPTWPDAQSWCITHVIGGRGGWHLPTVEQLVSLLDISAAGSPKLPAGSPFSVMQDVMYWSATTSASSTTFAWIVGFTDATVGIGAKSDNHPMWCVRGGQGYGGQ
jgi:hypothetical protein